MGGGGGSGFNKKGVTLGILKQNVGMLSSAQVANGGH